MGVVEDKLEILELIGKYSFGADTDGPEAYANVFTEDGIFHGRAGQPDEIIVRGHNQLLAFAARAYQGRGTRQGRHHQSTTMFTELTRDLARTLTYLITTNVSEGSLPLVGLTSVYEDEIVRTPEGWRIKYRKIHPDVKGILREIREKPR
ncbi:MAG: nuclear transport factor 2 family protein [Dehalococcoidia bacterium]|nr:nuclear transport factor 2 family protein [Dehalococcoidia bacterium]